MGSLRIAKLRNSNCYKYSKSTWKRHRTWAEVDQVVLSIQVPKKQID